MAHPALGSLLRYLRHLHDPSVAEATDEELLRRYIGGVDFPTNGERSEKSVNSS